MTLIITYTDGQEQIDSVRTITVYPHVAKDAQPEVVIHRDFYSQHNILLDNILSITILG